MARTSKKSKSEQILCSGPFYVGIYARLSVDCTKENKEKGVLPLRKNESIDTQLAMAKQYLDKHPEMALYDCYVDLGKTGTNFKREGFERMMEDVRKKRINCIIVKDLSRFGRNHIETGNYIQNIFPFMGVRFIALADGIDTFGEKSRMDELTLNVKNLVNEMYAKDIAKKVHASKKSRQEQGSYTGGAPPYGYRAEWREGKRQLFACPVTSGIVKDMYHMYLSGENLHRIVRSLYERGIHRPGIYKKTGHAYRQEGEILEQWSTGTVKLILTNPVYMGCLVQGKTQEPIVSEEQFFRVAAMLESSAAKYADRTAVPEKVCPGEELYAGILFCGDCGRRMVRETDRKGRKGSCRYYCPASRRMDELRCPAKSIGKAVLDELIKTALKEEFARSGLQSGRLIKKFERQAQKMVQKTRRELARCGKQKQNAKIKASEWYRKYREGILSPEEFQQKNKEKKKAFFHLEEERERLQKMLTDREKNTIHQKVYLQNLLEGEEMELTGDVLHALVQRIDVYGGKRLKVTFSFCRKEDRTGGGGNGGNTADNWEKGKK